MPSRSSTSTSPPTSSSPQRWPRRGSSPSGCSEKRRDRYGAGSEDPPELKRRDASAPMTPGRRRDGSPQEPLSTETAPPRASPNIAYGGQAADDGRTIRLTTGRV